MPRPRRRCGRGCGAWGRPRGPRWRRSTSAAAASTAGRRTGSRPWPTGPRSAGPPGCWWGRRAVAIFGAAAPRRWAPWGAGHRALWRDGLAEAVTLDEARAAVAEAWDGAA